ncbi:MAG: hypothetical protein UIM53_02995 [Acutalibacteraceae bacterium]|nr:hypothetical protein [Acutalibacteraceae bacterium]
MDKEMILDILDLVDDDFDMGVAEITVGPRQIQALKDNNLLDMEVSVGEGPSVKELLDFADRHPDKYIEFTLLVTEPSRADFRIAINAITIPPECTQLNNDKDKAFWADFMKFKKKGNPEMVDTPHFIAWLWNAE